MRLLIIGLDVVSIAASAKKIGYDIVSIDYFGDSDLRDICEQSYSIVEQRAGFSCGRLETDFNLYKLLVLARNVAETHGLDGVILSSGVEDYPKFFFALNELAPIIGNKPEMIERVRDKERFFSELKRMGVPYPETEIVETLEEAKRKAREIGYPIIVKPERSFGGSRIRKALNQNKLEEIFSSLVVEKFQIQKYIRGEAASASVISTTLEAHTLTVNEQLLGKRSLGQREPFGYCGNVVPLEIDGQVLKRCREIAEKVVKHFHLVGSNGVDLVITDKGVPKVIEVNPRFQGSLECVEKVLGINVVKAHIEACTLGKLPKVPNAKGYCARLILYALKRSLVPDLDTFKGVRDIPYKGAIIEEGEPFCSVVAEGLSRDTALKRATKIGNSIYRVSCKLFS